MNLEIVVDENHQLLAFRHDIPEDMQSMVLNSGHWQIFDEENISPEVLEELGNMIVWLKYEMCLN